jgi:Domain of unknown function (DUF4440)
MPNPQLGRARRLMMLLSMGVLLTISADKIQAQSSAREQTLWKLEHDYFRYVEDNNLTAYLALWHKNFLGWPSVSSAPVQKDHITDWVTSRTSKGLAFKLIAFKPAAVQVTGNIGVTCYWVTYKFAGKDGQGQTYTIRITHTWLKDGNDWHIIGGMSMPESGPPT